MLSLLGDIAPKEDGEPQVHDHVVLDRSGGTTRAATSSRLVCDAGGDRPGVAGAPLRRKDRRKDGVPVNRAVISLDLPDRVQRA